jgi:hypothetical protein
MPPTYAALDEEEVDNGECYARTSGIRWSNHELGTVDLAEEPAFWMRFEPQEVDEFVDSGMHGCGSDDAGLTDCISCGPQARQLHAVVIRGIDCLDEPEFIETLHELLHLQTTLHIRVRSFDQTRENRGSDRTFWPEFYMAHKPACAFQQALPIGDFSAPKEPDIDVSPEGIDVAKCRVSYTCGGMAVMQ